MFGIIRTPGRITSRKRQRVPIEEECYARLGIEQTASIEDIRAAFIERAKKFHPDLNPTDPVAEKKFKAISEAYSVLSGPGLRRRFPKKSSHIPGNDGADSEFDWQPTDPVSNTGFRVVVASLFIAIVLGTASYGATTWFDRSLRSDIASRSGEERKPRSARGEISDKIKPALTSSVQDRKLQETSSNKKIAADIKDVLSKEVPGSRVLAGEAGKDVAKPPANSVARIAEPASLEGGHAGATTVKLSKYRPPSKTAPRDIYTHSVDAAQPAISEPVMQGEGPDFGSMLAPKFVAADIEENAVAGDESNRGKVNRVNPTPDEESTDAPADAAQTSQTAAVIPPPLPKRKPHRPVRQLYDQEYRAEFEPRQFAERQEGDAPPYDFEYHAIPLDWPRSWVPGRWYPMGGRLCKIIEDGRLKCRRWRRIRDNILRRRVRRARFTDDPPVYWERGWWYYYRGRTCQVNWNGEFVCLARR